MLYKMYVDGKKFYEADLTNAPTQAQIDAKVLSIKNAGFTGRVTVVQCVPKTTYDETQIYAVDVV